MAPAEERNDATPLEAQLKRLSTFILATYQETWARYRGLLHVLTLHGVGPSEQIEREADEWIAENRELLSREAMDRVNEFVRALDAEPRTTPAEPPPPPSDQ